MPDSLCAAVYFALASLEDHDARALPIDAPALLPLLLRVYEAVGGTQFTCFTSAKVQIVTQKALLLLVSRVYAAVRGTLGA